MAITVIVEGAPPKFVEDTAAPETVEAAEVAPPEEITESGYPIAEGLEKGLPPLPKKAKAPKVVKTTEGNKFSRASDCKRAGLKERPDGSFAVVTSGEGFAWFAGNDVEIPTPEEGAPVKKTAKPKKIKAKAPKAPKVAKPAKKAKPAEKTAKPKAPKKEGPKKARKDPRSLKLNAKEEATLAAFPRRGEKDSFVELKSLAGKAFPHKGADAGKKGNSWVRNSVRKLLKLGLVKHAGGKSGEYARTAVSVKDALSA